MRCRCATRMYGKREAQKNMQREVLRSINKRDSKRKEVRKIQISMI